MKKTKSVLKALLLMALFLPALTFTSCSEVDDGSYVAPITRYEHIAGKWIISSITQIDETNQQKKDITGLFDFATFAIDLQVDSEGNPTVFKTEGTAPALIPTEGTWCLDSPYPIPANNEVSQKEVSIILNGNVTLAVTQVPGSDPTLKYTLTRKSNGIAFVTYEYNLIPAAGVPAEDGQE